MNKSDASSRLRKVTGLLSVTGILWIPALVFGADSNPFAPVLGFDVFVSGNLTNSSGHVQGPVALGGNLQFVGGEVAQGSAGAYVASGDTLASALVVGGTVQFGASSGNMFLNTPANVKIGSPPYKVWQTSPNATFINNGFDQNSLPRIETRASQTASSIAGANGISFAGVLAQARTNSSQMGALTPTITGTELGLDTPTSLNNFGLNPGLNVISLTGQQWRNIINLNWDPARLPSAQRTAIFNFDTQGASVYDLGPLPFGLAENLGSYIILNFYNLSGRLTVRSAVVASIYAPMADLTVQNSPVASQIVAKSAEFQLGGTRYFTNQVRFTPKNTPPTISSIANQTIKEDTSTAALDFRVTDVETPAANLTLTMASSNPTLIPTNNIVLAGSSENRTVTVTPATNQNGGPVTITLTVSDGSLSTNTTFAVTVIAANDPPVAAADTLSSIAEDSGARTIPFSVLLSNDSPGPANENNQTLTIVSVASPIGGSVTISGTDVIFTPAADFSGAAGFTYVIQDNGTTAGTNDFKTASASVSFSVTPVNDPPTITRPADMTISEDAGLRTVSLSGISAGGGESQALTLTATSSNPGLIPNPAVNYTSPNATGSLSFTPVADQSGTSTITVTVRDTGLDSIPGNSDDGITPITFTVTLLPVNDPPTISSIPDRTINEDAGPETVTLNGISAGGGESQALTITASSSNPGLIPNPSVTYTSPNSSGSLSFTPIANQSGTNVITVTVRDAGLNGLAGDADDGITTVSFIVTVLPVNDPPTISNIADQTIAEDTSTGQLSFTIGDIDTPITSLLVTAASSNPTLIPTNNIALGGSGTGRTITVNPATNQNGSSVITLTVSDGSLTASTNFKVTVTPVNDPPTIAGVTDLTINEDAGPQTVNLSGISAGGGESQTLTMTASSSNPALIPDPSVNYISPNPVGTLSFTPLPNQNGSAILKVTLRDTGLDGIGGNADDGITSITFTVTVNAVNDRPTISVIPDQTINEDTSTPALAFIVDDVDNPVTSLIVTVASSDTKIIPTANIVVTGTGANRTVVVTPAPNRNGGPVTITLTVSDGSLGAATSFLVRVNPVNDPPTITGIADQTINEDTSTGPLAFSVDDIDNALTDLTVTATSSDAILVPPTNIVLSGNGAARTVTVTPAADQNGSVRITLTVSDGSSSAATAFTVTVNPVNDPPQANNDFLSPIAEDSGPRTIPFSDLTKNDSAGPANESDQILTVVSVKNAIGGTVTIIGTNVVFTPATNYNGTASFTYTIQDNGTESNGPLSGSANVTFTIVEVNDPPVATDDILDAIAEDSGLRIIPFGVLLANDVAGPPNEAGQTLTIIGVTNAVGGAVTLSGFNVFFTPAPDYNGPASFVYTVRDNGTTAGQPDPRTASATVSFTITEVNDPPITQVTPLTNILEGSVLVVPISVFLTNDVPGPPNESDQTLSLIAVGGAVGGSVRIEGTNVIVELDPHFNGPGQFIYTVQDNGTTDGRPDFKTATATVRADVIPVNDPPVAKSASFGVDEDTAVSITLEGDDGDPEVNQVLTFALTVAPQHGTISAFNPATGTLVYTPAPNYAGADSFQFTVTDDATAGNPPNLTSAPGTINITVNPMPDVPTVTPATTQEGRQSVSGLVITRNPSDGPEVTHFKISLTRNGTLYQHDGTTVIANGAFITAAQGLAGLKFTPTAGLYSPGTTFGFEVQAALDALGTGLSQSASAVITVNPNLDFGDAPSPYPVLLSDNGARHVVLSTGASLFLGLNPPDIEADGQPSALATGDDNTGSQDEDGILLPAKIVAGQKYSVGIVASGFGQLNGWIDWNQDGDWNDAGEQVFVNQAVGVGTNFFELSAPDFVSGGTSFARFRLSTQSGLGPEGLASDGEVEDYAVNLALNSAPQANPDAYVVAEGGILLASDPTGTATPGQNDNGVLANDSDADGNSLTVSLLTGPLFAETFHLNSDGTFIYIHNGSENFADSFS